MKIIYSKTFTYPLYGSSLSTSPGPAFGQSLPKQVGVSVRRLPVYLGFLLSIFLFSCTKQSPQDLWGPTEQVILVDHNGGYMGLMKNGTIMWTGKNIEKLDSRLRQIPLTHIRDLGMDEQWNREMTRRFKRNMAIKVDQLFD